MTGPFAMPDPVTYLDTLIQLYKPRRPAGDKHPHLHVLVSHDGLALEAEPFLTTSAWSKGATINDALVRAVALLHNPLCVQAVPSILEPSWAGFRFDWYPSGTLYRYETVAVDCVGRIYQVEERLGFNSRPKVMLGGVIDPRPYWLTSRLQELAAAARSLRGWMSLN
jgi:hypothetical protein